MWIPFLFIDLSLLSMFTYSIKNHPLCGCGNDSYTKKITFLVYNVVVQATNIIRKGDFMATKTNSLSHTRGYANTILSSHLSIDEKSYIINIEKVYDK